MLDVSRFEVFVGGAHLSTADLGGTTNHLFSSSLTFDVASDTTAITTLKVGVISFGPLNSKVPDIYNILVKTGAFRGMAESFSGSCLHRLCEMSNDVEERRAAALNVFRP